jgi:hypothetical protein
MDELEQRPRGLMDDPRHRGRDHAADADADGVAL